MDQINQRIHSNKVTKNQPKKLIKISEDGFKKSINTIQDNLTQEDINILLEEYNQIESIIDLKEGIHIRYYTLIKKNGSVQQVFRMGGTIIKIDLKKNYAVLSNGKITWSIQLNDNIIIYKKMTIDEVKQFYENELDNKEIEVNKYKLQIEKLKIAYKELQFNNKNLKEELSTINKLFKKSGII